MLRSLSILTLITFSPIAWSIPLNTVGEIDLLLASESLSNSGQDTEESWVESVLGLTDGSINLTYKEEDNATDWQHVDGTADIYAFDLNAEPEFYLLKLGVGNSGADTHFLFQNFTELSWAVVDFAAMLNGQPLNFNFGRISHVTEFNSPVPEASSYMLLLFSLLGFISLRRR